MWSVLQGSGKTLAFGLPILHAILAQRDKHATLSDSSHLEAAQTLQALIFAPTRELAMQASLVGGQMLVPQPGNVTSERPAPCMHSSGVAFLHCIVHFQHAAGGLVQRRAGMQVCEHLRVFAKPAGIWVVPVVGGMSLPKQRRYGSTPHV